PVPPADDYERHTSGKLSSDRKGYRPKLGLYSFPRKKNTSYSEKIALLALVYPSGIQDLFFCFFQFERTIMSRNYGCFNFILDAVLTLLTGGLWIIWIFVREM